MGANGVETLARRRGGGLTPETPVRAVENDRDKT